MYFEMNARILNVVTTPVTSLEGGRILAAFDRRQDLVFKSSRTFGSAQALTLTSPWRGPLAVRCHGECSMSQNRVDGYPLPSSFSLVLAISQPPESLTALRADLISRMGGQDSYPEEYVRP